MYIYIYVYIYALTADPPINKKAGRRSAAALPSLIANRMLLLGLQLGPKCAELQPPMETKGNHAKGIRQEPASDPQGIKSVAPSLHCALLQGL